MSDRKFWFLAISVIVIVFILFITIILKLAQDYKIAIMAQDNTINEWHIQQIERQAGVRTRENMNKLFAEYSKQLDGKYLFNMPEILRRHP